MVSAFPLHVNVSFPTEPVNPNLVVRDGFPAGVLNPDVQPPNPRTVSFQQDFPAGYTQQRNFNIQRQLPGDMVFEDGVGGELVRQAGV